MPTFIFEKNRGKLLQSALCRKTAQPAKKFSAKPGNAAPQHQKRAKRGKVRWHLGSLFTFKKKVCPRAPTSKRASRRLQETGHIPRAPACRSAHANEAKEGALDVHTHSLRGRQSRFFLPSFHIRNSGKPRPGSVFFRAQLFRRRLFSSHSYACKLPDVRASFAPLRRWLRPRHYCPSLLRGLVRPYYFHRRP